MDFRELINKIDAINTEAKKEPERLAFDDAINYVKDIKFTPPTVKNAQYSISNNPKFKGQDVNDPKVKLSLFQDALKNAPAMLFGEIAGRIKLSSDIQIQLSDFVGNISNKLDPEGSHLGMLSKPEKDFGIEVVKVALRGMELERDPDQSQYKDDEEEMESVEEDSNFDKNFSKRIGYTVKGGKAADMMKKQADQSKQQNKDLDPGAAKKGLGIGVLDTDKARKKAKEKGVKAPGSLRASPNTRDPERLPEETEIWFQDMTDVTLNGDEFYETFGWIGENEENIEEAEYQGRTVKLNKPMRGDVKKFKVYVKNPKGNVVKVNFGDPDMKIKKSNPARRKSFRARHNCDTPGPKHKARYWSCRKW